MEQIYKGESLNNSYTCRVKSQMVPQRLQIKSEELFSFACTSGINSSTITTVMDPQPKVHKSGRKQNLSAVALEDEDNSSHSYRSSLSHDHVSMISKYRSFLCVICNTRRVGRTHAIPSDEFDMHQWLDVLKPPNSIRVEIIQRIESGFPQLLCSLHIKDGEPIDYLEPIREKDINPNDPIDYDPQFAAMADNLNWKARRRYYGGPEQEVVYRVEDLFEQKSHAVKLNEGGRTVMRSSGFKYLCLPAKTLLAKRTEDLLRETVCGNAQQEDAEDDLDFQSPTVPNIGINTTEFVSGPSKRPGTSTLVETIPNKLIKKE